MTILTLSLTLAACGSSDDTDADITNTSPLVDAGSDQSVAAGSPVTLTATITDDDSSFTIAWTQIDGGTVALSNTASSTTTFIAPTTDAEQTLTFNISVDDGTNAAITNTVSVIVSAEATTVTDAAWIINTDEVANFIQNSTSGNGVLVNVQSVAQETVSGKDYTVVNSQGIPKYNVTITQNIIDGLNSRPRADGDFTIGVTTAEVGDLIEFGQDIGYISTGDNCDANAGYGYWPRGPACPTEDERTVYFPNEPTATVEECENGLGKIGLFVNGSSIYNWGDGMSFSQTGDWQNLAPVAEQLDVDICGGHSANGDYHHHFYTSCLAELVADDGDEHSPLYGFAADGFPIYGPWYSDGELAQSSWIVRDYTAGAATGCADGERSCVLVDQYDETQGTTDASQGPAFTEVVTTLSGNELVASNGYYHEDYYWDSSLTALGGKYLDQYNGHTDTELGYHYHITLTEVDDNLTPAYPYIIGTRFAGQLEDNAVTSCDDGSTGGPPPPRLGG